MPVRAAPHIPPVPATCTPQLAYQSWFTGALLPICDVEVLIVVVAPRIMFDTYEANLYVSAFNLRFKRTIVLLSQDEQTLVPTFYDALSRREASGPDVADSTGTALE